VRRWLGRIFSVVKVLKVLMGVNCARFFKANMIFCQSICKFTRKDHFLGWDYVSLSNVIYASKMGTFVRHFVGGNKNGEQNPLDDG